MKKILVPVDFSTHTSVSSRYALQLAEVFGAEIILFHSFFDQFYYSDGGLSTGFESGLLLTDEIILDFYKQKENTLLELAKNLKSIISKEKAGIIKISCRMESGNPEIQIINAINQLKPDIIVMGSGGMGKKALLSGSVARRIIDHTDIPVIAIPDRKDVPALLNIAYMTTYDPGDAGVICAIDALLEPFNARFFCLHISKGEPDEEIMQKMNTLSESVGLKSVEGRITFHLESDDTDNQVLDNFMKANKIGLIAFIPHKRNIFEDLFYQGITREDLFKTNIPVMAFRPAR
jgi:nucleotide-binding universal stress UspA family protein